MWYGAREGLGCLRVLARCGSIAGWLLLTLYDAGMRNINSAWAAIEFELKLCKCLHEVHYGAHQLQVAWEAGQL